MAELNFDSIIKKHGGQIYNLAYRMTGNYEDAQDVVQETYLKAYKNRDLFKNESGIFTWIYRICINESLRLRKKRNTTYEVLRDVGYEAQINPDTQKWMNNPENAVAVKMLISSIRSECRHIVMQKLTDSQRSVYIMRVLLDMSYSEIADVLEIDVNAVKARLNRARGALLRHFDKHCEWFSKGERGGCCQKKIGYLLSQDTEILKRFSEDIKACDPSFDSGRDKRELIDYIYRSLPSAKLNFNLLKK